MEDFNYLQDLIIDRGLCTGCGTCVGVCPLQSIKMDYVYNELEPKLIGECNSCGICYNVCPGADVNIPELEYSLFGKNRSNDKIDLGVFRKSLKGFANDIGIRKAGASGGIISALLIHGLKKGILDCALVAGFKGSEPWRTEAKIARNVSEILNASRSKQAMVPVNSLLTQAIQMGFSKIAVVGLPCHIHGIRKMQHLKLPASLVKKIKLTLGLFCAGEFYFEGTKHIIQEIGKVEDFKRIRKIDYRGGDWPTYFTITLDDGREIFLDRHFCSLHMLIGVFKRDRCEVCIDWSNELADLAGGDYWDVSEAVGSHLGTSMCLVRSEQGEKIIKSAMDAKILTMDTLDHFKIISNFGFELKKHGAMFRLIQRRRFGIPSPNFHYENSYDPIIREFQISPSTGSKFT